LNKVSYLQIPLADVLATSHGFNMDTQNCENMLKTSIQPLFWMFEIAPGLTLSQVSHSDLSQVSHTVRSHTQSGLTLSQVSHSDLSQVSHSVSSHNI
jgi:hypothetical protein